jgi:hypothetical protein
MARDRGLMADASSFLDCAESCALTTTTGTSRTGGIYKYYK